jgi:uncharacterized hydrophobic protein (TIGR00271 family)
VNSGSVELIAKLGEVLDDAVVDDRDLLVLAHVRVGISVGRAAVSGPTSVTYSGGRLGQGILAQKGLEVDELAGLLAHLEASVRDDRDARRVVPAVFEAPKARHHDLKGLLLTDVTNDSAHDAQPTRQRVEDWAVLSLRVSCPAAMCSPVEAVLRAEPTISSLTVHRGASLEPQGDVFIADLPRESANALIDALMALGIQHEGTVTLTPVGTWISHRGLVAERRAPGRSPDSVVWAEVTERAYSETELTWTYVSFMILATLLAAIAIVTDSAILVIGAMVLGPEFVPIAALGLGMVRRRPALVRRAVRTLVIGFAISIAVVAAVALVARATGVIDVSQIESARPGTAFIYTPNWWSLTVSVLAGAAGVLSLTAAKGSGLVGVFISVTTIPASGNVALAIVFGVWSEVLGSTAQLAINIIGMGLAGWATLALQQFVWGRISSRRQPRTRPAP